jgi:uncharacterized protein YbjT (DUF2867 family)
VVPLYLARAFADHEAQEAEVRASDVDWTLVRPPTLTHGPRTGDIHVDFAPGEPIAMKISRADVAAFMLGQVDDRRFVRRTVAISQ